MCEKDRIREKKHSFMRGSCETPFFEWNNKKAHSPENREAGFEKRCSLRSAKNINQQE
jgi:hypothetical protein